MKPRLMKSLATLALLFGTESAALAFTIYYDNSATKWESVGIHYWSNPSTEWPGVEIDHVEGDIWSYTFPKAPTSLDGFLFKHASLTGDAFQTADYKGAPKENHIYKGAGGEKGKVTDEGEYKGAPAPTTSTVKASPRSGTRFSESVTVSLTANPVTAIYYTTDGSVPTTASKVYTAPLTFTSTTNLKTLTVLEGQGKEQTFTYTKREMIDMVDGYLTTDYYQVNPNGQVGTNRTVDMKFTRHPNTNYQTRADNALNNWTEADLICQGVARDIASAFKGKHEYPVIDSYAIYGAYDSQNLYLGVQYVYAVYDEAGDGKSDNDRHRPWMMDGRIMLAFDLDPEKEFEGKLSDGNTIWDADGQYNVMKNGTDCIWLGNTKPGVGQPRLFFPNEKGVADYYDPASCVEVSGEPYYGSADGLLPSIEHIWGQDSFGYDPAELCTNQGFVDLINEVPRDKHTFYEWKFPLAKLGVTEDYIRRNGIGVMVIDTYGQGAIGCTPYDPAVFDNALESYSKDPSSSKEKEDMDIFTSRLARIGGKADVSGIEAGEIAEEETLTEYYTIDGFRVANPSKGLYIKRRGVKIEKVVL